MNPDVVEAIEHLRREHVLGQAQAEALLRSARGDVVSVELELLLLLPQAVATITVAASVANPTSPVRPPLVMSFLL